MLFITISSVLQYYEISSYLIEEKYFPIQMETQHTWRFKQLKLSTV